MYIRSCYLIRNSLLIDAADRGHRLFALRIRWRSCYKYISNGEMNNTLQSPTQLSQPTNNKPEIMDLRRKETKLNVITSGISKRGRHAASHSVGHYYTTHPHRASLGSPSGVRVVARDQYYRALPPTSIPPYRPQSQQPMPRTAEVQFSNPSPVVFLLDRSTFAEPSETPNDNIVLRRKAHIRRQHRRAISECPGEMKAVFEVPTSRDLGKVEALTPLIEAVAEMYSGPSRRGSSYTNTMSSPSLEEGLDSPSVYSPCDDDERLREEEFLYQPFVQREVDALPERDWANVVRDWDTTKDEIPEGRLLPKRVVTVHLKALLRRRREEAGLPERVPDSPDDH